MTLTLAAPDATPIRTYPNGLKVVRLTDYIGAARGTLTTVADTAAVAGNVVKDSQTVAVPTTFVNQWTSVADSVTIPVADFAYPAESSYTGYLSLRCEGRPPVNARAREKFNIWNSTSTPNVQIGRDGVEASLFIPVPREHYSCYQMLQLGGFSSFFDSGATDINIRAWGIAGGTWVAWYLDCLYLIPNQLKDTDTGSSSDPNQFAWYIGQEIQDPAAPATDVDPNTQLGERSTFWIPRDIVTNYSGAWDIQDSDGEETESDWHPFWFGSDPALEVSYIYWVGLCSRLIAYHEIENADFSDTGPDPTPAGPFVQFYVTPQGYRIQVFTGGDMGEYYFADGVMRFRCYIEPTEVPPSYFPRGPSSDNDRWSIGALTAKVPFNSTDPRTYAAEMDSLESYVFTVKCRPIDGIPLTGMRYWWYGERFTRENSAIASIAFGPMVDIDSSGSATVQFRIAGNTFSADQMFGDVAAVTGNLSNDFWVKYEKRLYVWRVKVWLDGDPEPNDWLLQTNEPADYVNSISGTVILPYPWDTGYPVTGNTSTINEPNRLPDETNNTTGTRGWTPGGMMLLNAGFNQPGWRFDQSPIIVEYDPDIEGSGSYTGANFRLEKYDGTVQWGQVYVDPGMCRVAFSDYAPHHFEGSTHGGNIIAWKEPGGHPLQTAGYSVMSFRRYLQGGIIPLFRPRVFSVK